MKTKTQPDYRTQLYESVRISKKAKAALAARATKERRTMIATLDIVLGV